MAQNNFNLAQAKALNEEYLRRIGYLPVATMPNGPFPRKNFIGKIHGFETILYAQDVKVGDVVHTGTKHGKVTSVATTGTKVTINYTLINNNVPAGVKPQDHVWLEAHVFVATKVTPGASGASDTGSYLKLAHPNLIFFRQEGIVKNILIAGDSFEVLTESIENQIALDVFTVSFINSLTPTNVDVDVSVVTPSSDNANVYLNVPFSTVIVKAGTALGVYTIVYRLTDKADSSNFAQGTITVTLSA